MRNIVITLITIIFFFINLNLIGSGKNFVGDELYYIPAARSYLEGDFEKNSEHPPTGKLILAFGIKIFGDNPYGWRIFPLLFGAAGIILTSFVASQIYKNKLITIFSALLVALTPYWNIYSRIASLDIVVSTMIVFSAVFLWKYLNNPSLKSILIFSIILGIACSVKWVGFFYLWTLFLLIIALKSFTKRVRFQSIEIVCGIIMLIGSYLIFFVFIYWPDIQKVFTEQLTMLSVHLIPENIDILNTNPSPPFTWFIPSLNPLPLNTLTFWTWPFVISYLIFESVRKINSNIKRAFSHGFIVISFLSLYLPWFYFSRPTYVTYTMPLIPFISIGSAFVLNLFYKKSLRKLSKSTIFERTEILNQ